MVTDTLNGPEALPPEIFDLEQVERAFEMFKQFKIKAGAGFMFGFPGETIEDVHETLALAKRIEPEWAYFQVYVGFPTGELYDYIIANGLYDLEWNGVYKVKPDRLSMEELPNLEKWLTEEFDKDKWMKSMPLASRIFVKAVKILESALEKAPRVRHTLKAAKDHLPFLPTIKH